MKTRRDDLTVEVRVQGACFSEGMLLCARHRKSGDGYWVLPGGHLDYGESVWDALVREFREETRLEIDDGSLWAVSEFQSPDRHVIDCTFLVASFHGVPRLGTDPEVGSGAPTLVGLRWLDREAFVDAPFRPTLLGRHLRAHWDDRTTPASYLGVESI